MSAFSQFSDQRSNPEFQSAVVRLLIWLFLFVYIGLGAATEYYQVRMEQYYILFFFFLVVFIALFASVMMRPVWLARQYFALAIDVAATSFSIFLTQDAVSPIFLFYIWIFVSYGTRYGKQHLLAATLVSLFAYTLVMSVLGGWSEHAFEASFFLCLLVILPMYQYSLLKKLHHARREAEAANHARGRFLATMTHELRTPLSGIVGMVNIIDDRNFDLKQQQQLSAIKYSAEKLQQLIGDILDFSSIDAGKLEIDRQPVEIRQILSDVCSNLSLKADEKGLRLSSHVQPGVPEKIISDPLRINQVLTNLVGNAIKFTDRGEVRIDVWLQDALDQPDRQLIIEVSDTGIGIGDRELKTIFDPFRQADDSSTRRFGGTGLGTTISKNLVQLMGGDIKVRSKPGQGSIFSIFLPVIQAGDLGSQPADTGLLNTPDTFDARQSMNILVAEDDPISAQLLSFLLNEKTHKVTLVEDGYSALQEARSGIYDMVFVDLHMPQMDGVEFTRHLRKGAMSVRSLPIFALTANASEDARDSCLQAGVNEFLVKPLTPASIDQLVKQYS